MAMPTKYVTVDGTAVHYFHTGPTTLPGIAPDLSRGELLVFLHDAGSNGHTWHSQLAAFAQRDSPLALDFPGHGRSGGTESLKSIAAYAVFLAAFLDALGARPCVLVGCGMGGAVAIEIALAQPGRVRALVLVAAAARFDLPQSMLDTWRDVMRGRAPQPFTAEAFSPQTDFAVMREMWMEQVQTDPRVRYFDLLACNQFDVTAQLGAVAVPTLIAAGRDDAVTPPARAEALQRGIPDARLVVVDGAGHALPNEKPAELNQALAEFVEGLR
jgi:3-oxoadipate enol-lactonase / 4-carboxymuconolactone decarboxylase